MSVLSHQVSQSKETQQNVKTRHVNVHEVDLDQRETGRIHVHRHCELPWHLEDEQE